MSDLDREVATQSEQPTPRRRRADRHLQFTENSSAESQQVAATPQEQANSAGSLFASKAPAPVQRTYNPDLAPLHPQTETDSSPQRAPDSQLDLSGSVPAAQRSEQERKLDFTPTRRPVSRTASLGDTDFTPSAQPGPAMQKEPVAETYAEDSGHPRRGWLVALIIILLILALLIGGYFLIPSNAGGVLGRYKSFIGRFLPGGNPAESNALVATEAEILGFNAAPTTGSAPALVNLTVTTSMSVEDVRLVDENGSVQNASVTMIPSPGESMTWLISLPVQEPQTLRVTIQYHDGESWQSYDQYLSLSFE